MALRFVSILNLKLLVHPSQTVIFLCFLVFGALCIPFVSTPTKSELGSKGLYTTPNLTANEIVCGFPVSGQYGRTSQFTYLVLLATTVILRKLPWLAVGIATYSLSYSGVAAIHQIVLFARNNRFSPTRSHAYCEFLDIGHQSNRFPACAGVWDPDFGQTSSIIGAGLLAALPIATYSSTFRKAEYRPILIMWTLLLAAAYVFCSITVTDPNRHYQICPAGISETVPGSDYQAVVYNDNWRHAFGAISSGVNHTSVGCIYSCFVNDYLGRLPEEIGVYQVKITEKMNKSHKTNGISFWVSYIPLMVLMIIINHKKMAAENVCPGQEYQWPTLSTLCSSLPQKPWYCHAQWCIQAICVVYYVMYIKSVIAQQENVPFSESFSSVGQWSVVATVGLTLSATILNKVYERWTTRSQVKEQVLEVWEPSQEIWGCEVGYAS